MSWIVIILLLCGTFFTVVASIGILRMPDLYMRMSATTKAATLGVGFMLVAAAVFFEDVSVTSRSVVAILFVFLTAPVGAHMIGRAAYIYGIKLWDKSKKDDLKEKYRERKDWKKD